jgi:hypothetical protein
MRRIEREVSQNIGQLLAAGGYADERHRRRPAFSPLRAIA